MKTVSVITVCMNAADHIEEAIRSVKEQTYPCIEYLVIDGASTDGTLDVIQPHRSRIDHLVSEPDTGLYHAMNKGVQTASGDVLYFLNADDRLHDPNVLADMMKPFNHDPDLDLAYGEILLDRNGQLVDWWMQITMPDRRGLCKSTICHQSLLIRASLFESTGPFDEQYRAVADYDWIYRAVVESNARIVHLDRRVAVVGTMGITFSTSEWKREKRDVLRRYYSRREIFCWRTIPRHIVPKIRRAQRAILWPARAARRTAGRVLHAIRSSSSAAGDRNP
jgi:glycosyltransferase involved in cell wall biosynthesis